MASDMQIIRYLEAGIRTESARQNAIASNIANISTPGYRRVDVKFNEILADKINNNNDLETEDENIELFTPMNTAAKPDGNDVSLDGEIGEMVENSLKHKTYTRILAQKYRQMDLAINFNK
ncbi:MAG: flagellar basal-body rod protein FlgB [Candidatus Aquicultor primus]|uniref:Flagellar basal body rod protein FlgB n=1 Tax=Candidatus Aquicultor primus TaxID=1797195 RepID=A0A1F2UIQ6_9ACTN|nr:MAG: flagellar basal-body rod protein FlgB [Candidatus Aquicultor primus]